MTQDGKCEECKFGTFPDETGRECKALDPEKCHRFTYVDHYGECHECPIYSFPDLNIVDSEIT
jgi:hypothetical protein